MVYVYISDISNLPDPKEFPESMNGIPEERKEKIRRYRQALDRKQCLGAGLCLEHIFARHGIKKEGIRYGVHGKPEVDGIHFNLSHSHDYVVCVVADKAVGCDIEKIEKIRERVAERFFTEKEVAHLNSFEEEKKTQEFYRIWTMKESYLKMTGEGMSFSTKRIEFIFDNEVKIYRDGKPCACFIKEYMLPGFKLTVCSKENDFEENLRIMEF